MNTRMLQIQIDSNKHFPSVRCKLPSIESRSKLCIFQCGSVGSYNFILEHSLGTCPGKEQTASTVHQLAMTLSTSSRWPSLGTISPTNAFEPLVTPPAPKLLQVTSSKMSAARRRNAVAVPARSVDVDEEQLETERFPEFRNDLCWPLRRLSDPRRLLTLWFDFGQYPKVFDALVEGMRMVKIITWFQLIRQLKIQIDNPRIQML
ncbi:FKBP-rapamycin associated protein [Culex quinquefasciatus]|uniref:FKBP-rapamycin associated protein n=1 Tax=Culex quinquefasciatus TaxID=7176 RepID=B0W691_CULQU|nr:FKBP-rapamycin associated protein [Culex quinquefasciatus]|eukprot:XP_001844225.1 FKBP-rapamycin associated protein [Culex quinquefasciatus]